MKYAKGQPNSVGSEDHFQHPHLGLGEDQSPEKEHWANQDASSAGALSKATGNFDWNLWNGSHSWFSAPAIPLVELLFSKIILHCK